MWYWLEVIAVADNITGVWSAVFERLIGRDIIIILLLVCVYCFEYLVIMRQNKWKGLMSQVIVILFGLVMFICIYTIYFIFLYFSFTGEINFWGIVASLLPWSLGYFICAAFIFIKEYFKKKEAYDYALEIQTADVKLELLKALLNDGVLTQEEFDEQKVKLLEV